MNSSAKSGVGTPIYMAPEIVYGGTRYDAKVCPYHHLLICSLDVKFAHLDGIQGYLQQHVLHAKVKCGHTSQRLEGLYFEVHAVQRADIWSCGVILFAMLYGRYPFNAKDKDYMRKIVTAQYEMPEDVEISPNCRHTVFLWGE